MSCVTLQDAINYLVDRTEGVMTPLILEEEYEENICTYSNVQTQSPINNNHFLLVFFLLFFFLLDITQIYG